MRIATWNVNGLRARYEFFLHWLRDRRPDLVALQEIKSTEDQFPFQELASEGYSAVVHGQKGWNGVAILSRHPVANVIKGLPSDDEPEARLISAEVGDLRFTSVYCPNGKSLEHPDYLKKLRWFDRLQDLLVDCCRPDSPLIVAGDFNICATSLDTWNEEALGGGIHHSDEERRRLQRLAGWGLHDIFRKLHPDLRAYSWWDYRAGAFYKNEGLRIDLILGTEAAIRRIRSIEIDRDYRKKKDGLTASDHAPVLAEIDA